MEYRLETVERARKRIEEELAKDLPKAQYRRYRNGLRFALSALAEAGEKEAQ